jgi:glycerate-2-kinase
VVEDVEHFKHRVDVPLAAERDALLQAHKSEIFFDGLGDSIQFESKTNVNDLIVVLVDPKE